MATQDILKEDLLTLDPKAFYLKHIDIAQRIAFIGYADVVKSHSYTARARKIIEDLRRLDV